MNRKFAKAVAILTLVAMLVTTVMFVALAPLAFGAERTEHTQSETDQYRQFLLENYKDKIDPQMLAGKSVDEMTEFLHEEDPYTEVFKGEEETAKFSEMVDGEYMGIGITASKAANGIEVVEVNPDGSAKRAGVQVGDIIIAIDGVDVRSKELGTSLDIIKNGKRGTKAILDIIRNKKAYRLEPIREDIKMQSVKGGIFEEYPKVGYIVISQFDSDTASEFATQREELIKKGADKFVLDLRSNPGGILEQSVAIAEQMMPKSSTITKLSSRGKIVQEYTVREGAKKIYPTVVLINENSASAAELLAGALQDNGVAKMIGNTTYGKGVGQQVVGFKNGDAAKVSVFYFTTPKGHIINKLGIKPDVTVFNAKPATSEEKRQMASFESMDGDKKYVKGEYGAAVLGAQQRLAVLGYYKGSLNGQFDEETAKAVQDFQNAMLLYPYPCLDNTTRSTLKSAIAEKLEVKQKPNDHQLARGIKELGIK